MRLAIIAVLLKWSLSEFHLVGPVLVVLLATVAFKAAALVRMKKLLAISPAQILPWGGLASVLGAAAGAGGAAFAVNALLHLATLPLLAAMGIAYTVTYAALLWYFDLLESSEKLALAAWARKLKVGSAAAFDYGKG
jgi:hypothetical protein